MLEPITTALTFDELCQVAQRPEYCPTCEAVLIETLFGYVCEACGQPEDA